MNWMIKFLNRLCQIPNLLLALTNSVKWTIKYYKFKSLIGNLKK